MRGHSRACYICYLLSIELIHVIYWLGYMHLTMIVRREADLEWNLYASILIETFDLLAIVLSVMLHLVSILSLFILIQFLFFFPFVWLLFMSGVPHSILLILLRSNTNNFSFFEFFSLHSVLVFCIYRYVFIVIVFFTLSFSSEFSFAHSVRTILMICYTTK